MFEDQLRVISRMKAEGPLPFGDPDYPVFEKMCEETREALIKLNSSAHGLDVINTLIEITKQTIDFSNRVFPPFYINFGRMTRFGKNDFINFNCTFLDMGGITLGDRVFIGPGCTLATEYHDEDPVRRLNTLAKPIVLKDNAWIGANVTILAGVTVGRNAIVGAGSIVLHDVHDNEIVAGNPARHIRWISERRK